MDEKSLAENWPQRQGLITGIYVSGLQLNIDITSRIMGREKLIVVELIYKN